jgi:broad specificity phosphatase PhoE
MSSGLPAIPTALAASIDATSAPRVLFVRHSDRPALAANDAGFELALTAVGRERARALSLRLKEDTRWAVSSPYRRCVETAECAGFTAESSHLLGGPGPYVIDRERGGEVFGKHGTEVVVRRQIAGETWGCMRPVEEGANLVLNWLEKLLDERGGEGLAVSHDAIVMPTIAWATGLSFEDSWIAPLDGAVLIPGAIVYAGQRYELPR